MIWLWWTGCDTVLLLRSAGAAVRPRSKCWWLGYRWLAGWLRGRVKFQVRIYFIWNFVVGSHEISFNSIRRFLLQRPTTFCVIKKLYRTDTSGKYDFERSRENKWKNKKRYLWRLIWKYDRWNLNYLNLKCEWYGFCLSGGMVVVVMEAIEKMLKLAFVWSWWWCCCCWWVALYNVFKLPVRKVNAERRGWQSVRHLRTIAHSLVGRHRYCDNASVSSHFRVGLTQSTSTETDERAEKVSFLQIKSVPLIFRNNKQSENDLTFSRIYSDHFTHSLTHLI